jgi:hypothetical protein
MKKISLFHDETETKPLPEWGVKLLPSVVERFRYAESCIVTEEVILSVVIVQESMAKANLIAAGLNQGNPLEDTNRSTEPLKSKR